MKTIGVDRGEPKNWLIHQRWKKGGRCPRHGVLLDHGTIAGRTTAIGSPALYNMPAYTLVNLQAGVKSQDDRLRVYLWGKNVTNRFYVNNVVELEDDVIRYTGRPITYGISVGYRFE